MIRSRRTGFWSAPETQEQSVTRETSMPKPLTQGSAGDSNGTADLTSRATSYTTPRDLTLESAQLRIEEPSVEIGRRSVLPPVTHGLWGRRPGRRRTETGRVLRVFSFNL
jgi:hypothetical protein